MAERAPLALTGWVVAGVLGGLLVYEKLKPTAATPASPAAVVRATPAPAPEPPVEAGRAQPPSTLHEVLLKEFATLPPPPWPQSALPAPVSSPTPEPSPVPPAEELRTGLDGERDKAAFLKPQLEQMAQGVRGLKGLRTDYEQACSGEMTVTYKDDSGQGQVGSIRKAETPECVSKAAAISDLQDGLKKEGAALEEAGRRAGVLPGILRELVATHGLEGYMNP